MNITRKCKKRIGKCELYNPASGVYDIQNVKLMSNDELLHYNDSWLPMVQKKVLIIKRTLHCQTSCVAEPVKGAEKRSRHFVKTKSSRNL